MPRSRPSLRTRVPWVSLGFSLLLAALVGVLLVGPSGKPAQGADLSSSALTAFQTTDKLVVNVQLPSQAGDLSLALIDDKGDVVAREGCKVEANAGSQRLTFKRPAQAADKLRLRCRFGEQKVEVPLSTILLLKAHETTLTSGQDFYAGSTAALRCEVHGVKSYTRTVPLPEALVQIKLIDKTGAVHRLHKGKTGADGVAGIQLHIPADVAPGAARMEIFTQSGLGQETLSRDVQIRSSPRVLLVTDKPLYQPGQQMHIRALALQAFDLKPVAGSVLVFEVQDGKGNKVFKREQKTSAHGIAAVDFQLADEVNTGDYQIRAILGDKTADKTVAVKPYVLPKFKNALETDKRYYLPKETIHAELQTDYFFGKPVAGSKVKVTASTFDVAFREFQTWQGKTDAQGHVKFDVKLPDYFVGQPLQKGNAVVKLEVQVTDTADHSETLTRTYPVAQNAIQVSLIPEGGRIVPDMENRIFAAAIYPDGSPAKCDIDVWIGQQAKDRPLAHVKTNEAGLAEVRLTPKAGQLRQGGWGMRNIEMVGGQNPQMWGPQQLLDLTARARDRQGNDVTVAMAINSDVLGENVVLRLNKAVYKGGEPVGIDIRSSAGMPTVYLDLVKDGQTLLTKWLDVKDGRAEQQLDLPPSVFGTLEVHAYQVLAHGEIIRDSRVVYVNPASDLKIDVKADKDVYLPGEKGSIRFQVSDSAGKPQAAALGVLIVDEAVYALQEMQPGLEKVYFTLQEELLKPKTQVIYKPREGLDTLVRQPELDKAQQQAAEVLLTAVRPKAPARWEVNPVLQRRQAMQAKVQQIGMAVFNYAANGKTVFVTDKKTGAVSFQPNLMADMVKDGYLAPQALDDSMGGKLTPEDLAQLEKGFTARQMAEQVTRFRMSQLASYLVSYSVHPGHQQKFFKENRWTFPETTLADAVNHFKLGDNLLRDAWGRQIKLVARDKKRAQPYQGWSQLDYYDLVSAGPDGKVGSKDDITLTHDNQQWMLAQVWWMDQQQVKLALAAPQVWGHRGRGGMWMEAEMARGRMAGGMPIPAMRGMGGGGAMPPGAPMAMKADGFGMMDRAKGGPGGPALQKGQGGPDSSGGPAPPRMREYFPETLLWQPALITDENGRAVLPIDFADSITTWRLTASASSRGGLLGGVSAPLRVFQDFFVDLDLPIALTQNDEVAFPVAVYNYLKQPQTVKLDLQTEPWFELVDGQGLSRSLDLKPNEVTSIKYRIRAKRIGHFPLTVKATGSKMSDAIKRGIDVQPDGKKIEQVATDRLKGTIKQTITIPDNAIPDASRLLVKVYPGVMSQVLEGAEGMLRMPCGCFEQTSSSAYPNILVADYIKKARLASPEMLLKAETYLNAGYQRLLTFERPGGGFDWWGSGPPLIWLSAYGLQEFNDMSKVYPVDRGVITRTQNWLMKQRDADGTWSNIGATHSETIASMGSPKLLLTSYVVWSLLDSGLKSPELKKSVEYIRDHVKEENNAYILALAANALASWDAKDDSTHDVLVKVLGKLHEQREARPQWQALCFPAKGQSLVYARGESLTVETTALAVLAMIKNGQFANDVNQALTYLIKSKEGSGTWGSTSATILSLKALVASAEAPRVKDPVTFDILVGGKQLASGEVNDKNSDVMQLFDLKEHVRTGANEVTIQVKGETSLMYQVVGRHFEPWKQEPKAEPVIDVAVSYDRTKLSTKDLLRAKATVSYHGKVPTYMVIVDLGIAPGFTVDPGDFAEMVGARKIQKYSVTARQVILYLGDVKPGDVLSFEYTLKPKYPIKAKTPATVVYEYNTPANRAAAKPVELVVDERR